MLSRLPSQQLLRLCGLLSMPNVPSTLSIGHPHKMANHGYTWQWGQQWEWEWEWRWQWHYTPGLPRCEGTTTLVHSSTEYPDCWQQHMGGRYSFRWLPPNWSGTPYPVGPASKTWESTASETCSDQKGF